MSQGALQLPPLRERLKNTRSWEDRVTAWLSDTKYCGYLLSETDTGSNLQPPMSQLLLLLLFLVVVQGPSLAVASNPCPLGSRQKEVLPSMAVAVTPSKTNACGKEFMISMDRANGEPSVVLLSFDPLVLSQNKQLMPAVLEIFVTRESTAYFQQNITIFGYTSKSMERNDTDYVSWNSSDEILKPFDPYKNWMVTCSDNVIREDTATNLGYVTAPDAENLSDQGGISVQIDLSKAILQGFHSFALVRMIECEQKPDGKQDVPTGNVTLSSLCTNDTDFHGQQYPPRIIFGPNPPPEQCTYKRGYYKIHIDSRNWNTDVRQEYFLTHSLKSSVKSIDVTSSWWIHKLSNSRKLWKIRKDTLSGTPTTFFGVKRRSKYSYLGGTSGYKPSLGTKKDTMRIVPRRWRCSMVDCGNVYLVSDKRKKQGKKSYLTIDIERTRNKTVAWKYSWEVQPWNGVFQLIPA